MQYLKREHPSSFDDPTDVALHEDSSDIHSCCNYIMALPAASAAIALPIIASSLDTSQKHIHLNGLQALRKRINHLYGNVFL
jgi:hypothetical protein